MVLDLDTFGGIIDKFIRESDIRMLIELPKGTQKVEVTCTGVSTVDFFVLLQAIRPVFVRVIGDMGGAEAINAEGVLDGLWEVIREGCLDALKGERKEHVRNTDAAAAGRDGGEAADL